MDLQSKTVLVTGGGTGLGREVSLALARKGADIAVNYSHSREDAEATVGDVRQLGRRAIAVQADVSKTAEVQAMVDAVLKEFGRIDVLINNAGFTVFVDIKDLDGISEEDWDHIMSVNVKGVFLCSRAVAPAMNAQKGGRIVNITSVAGLRAGGSSIPYSVSKAAETMLTKCLAMAMGPYIQVNAVAPGLMDTRWGRRWDQQAFDRAAQAAPIGRIASLEDIAATVVYLVKNDSMTGQSIAVDGGSFMH